MYNNFLNAQYYTVLKTNWLPYLWVGVSSVVVSAEHEAALYCLMQLYCAEIPTCDVYIRVRRYVLSMCVYLSHAVCCLWQVLK